MAETSPEWHPDDDPLDPKFVYRAMKVLPPIPQTPPRPEEQMHAWQQYQRLKFEFKERSLPLDGSYKPPVPPGGYPPRVVAKSSEPSGLHRSTSVPALQSDSDAPRSSVPPGANKPVAAASKPLQRGMSGLLNKPRIASSTDLRRNESGNLSSSPGGWARATSPSVDLTNMPQSRPKSGSFMGNSAARRQSVSGGNDGGLRNVSDLVEKSRQGMGEKDYDKALSAYTEIVCEMLAQRALCLIHMEDYPEAVVNCEFALHFKSGHGKALIRKAKALCKLQRMSEAKACRAVALPYLKPEDLELFEVGTLLGLNDGTAPPKQSNGEDEGSSSEEPAQEVPAKVLSPKVSPKEMVKTLKEGPAKIPSPLHSPKESATVAGPLSPKGVDPATLPPPPDPSQLPPPPVLPDSAGRGVGRVIGPRTTSGSASGGRGTPVAQRRDAGPSETPLSPGAVKKALPAAPTAPTRTSVTLKKPTAPAPVAPPKRKKDPLDASWNYAELPDEELPALPGEPPSIDEDMQRWQQYQRLKSEYRDRNIELRFEA